MSKIASKIAIFFVLVGIIADPLLVVAQADFNPHFIISDQELQDLGTWTRADVQKFLDSKGSYLRTLQTENASGTPKLASDIIYDAAQMYQINPKYILVTLQKEQSLVTDDSPTQKQLDWAAGYGVCDSCGMDDEKIQKFRGFGKQVDNAAGIMRWYYEHEDQPFIKRKDNPIRIDDKDVTPQSWATAFLYTYTPHLHGNKNFWRIWDAWFSQVYPNGTLLKSAESGDYWLVQEKTRRRFKNKSALISRLDPKLAVTVPDIELNNYTIGAEISFPNYSLLKAPSGIYLIDYEAIRPFASEDVLHKLGYNPQELIDVEESDLSGFIIGSVITVSSTAPQGIIYQISDLKNTYYLLKDTVLYPITDKHVIETNYKTLRIEKHKTKELSKYQTADLPVTFKNGTLIETPGNAATYVIEQGKRRRIADEETFKALGYKHANVVSVDPLTILNLPEGERLFLNSNLLSAKNKFLGDSVAPVPDQYATAQVPTYLVAEYPSGRIVSGKNVDTKRSIASLTKLLVAYEAVQQNYNFNKVTTYVGEKYAAGTNAMQLKDGEKLRNKDIFASMLIASNNTAARMVAQGTGLSETEIVRSINERLEEWGADNTSLTDVTGLDEGDKSTARDLLKIFTKVLSNKIIKDTLFQTTYTFNEVLNKNKLSKHQLKHTNQLIGIKNRNYRILASKTGFTDEAGALMIMLIESRKAKKQYVVLTMGNTDYKHRFEEPHKIASWVATGDVKIAAMK